MKKMLTISLALIMITISGCKKTEPEPEQPVGIEQAFKDAGVEVTGEMKTMIDEAQSRGEQTICPVMGGKILKDVFVEYKGKKVYFCCPGCEKSFNEDPEKYLSKLPQFGGKE